MIFLFIYICYHCHHRLTHTQNPAQQLVNPTRGRLPYMEGWGCSLVPNNAKFTLTIPIPFRISETPKLESARVNAKHFCESITLKWLLIVIGYSSKLTAYFRKLFSFPELLGYCFSKVGSHKNKHDTSVFPAHKNQFLSLHN